MIQQLSIIYIWNLRFSFHKSLFLLLLFLFQFTLPIEVEAAKKSTKSKVTINLPKTLVLKEFIKIISEKTGTVFVYEEKNLRSQMSITAPPNLKVSAKDALYFFEKILQTQGLALVPRANSNVVEILPAAEARFLRLNISQEVPLDTDQELSLIHI